MLTRPEIITINILLYEIMLKNHYSPGILQFSDEYPSLWVNMRLRLTLFWNKPLFFRFFFLFIFFMENET